MWSRIRPRCAISLGKSIVVAYSNSRSPREYEFARHTFAAAASALGYFSQLAFYKAQGQFLKANQAREAARKDEAKKHDTDYDTYSNEAVRDLGYAHWFGGLALILFLLGIFFGIGALLMPS